MRNNEEHKIQCAIVEHARLRWPELNDLMFAIPNGGNRSAITGAMLKREGALAGVFDLFIAIARQGYHGLWIEVKTPKASKRIAGGLSQPQQDFEVNMRLQGYLTFSVNCVDEALELIEWYLG